MSVRSNKPWLPIEPATLDALPGQLGVFELADASGEVIFIGRADARTRFGLRGEVAARVAGLPQARAFRVEVTTAYHTRHLELLMAHRADHGRLPRCNEPMPTLGRLSPAGAPPR